MSSLSRELVFLTLQFLDEEKFKKTIHKLEQESGFFFNMKYFEDEVRDGNWDEVEEYLSGFTEVDDNRYSMKMFFEIRKQKYLEALDRHDHPRAVNILVNDLKVFASYNEDLFKEITQLLTLGNFRENQQLSKYGDTKSARAIMLVELKKLIEANPLFHDKLQFPNLKNSRLRTLINQSLNWQHQLCKNPRPNPDIKTLFTDHSCGLPSGVYVPSLVSSPLSKPVNFPSLGTHMPFQPSPAPVPVPPVGWMSNSPAIPVVPGGAIGLGTPTVPATILNQVKTPQTSNLTIKHSSTDSDFASKRTWSIGITDKSQLSHMTDELPKTVAAVSAGTTPVVMDKASLSVAIIGMNGDCGNLMNIKPRLSEEMTDRSNIQKLTENNVSTQCRSLRLMGNEIPCKISRLMYANSGAGILALASNATHFLWKLPRSHPVLKATVCVTPKVWQPSSGIFMKNDIPITNPGESVSCFALSKNDCYVISASGGTISLFNMATFERMTTFMPSPPAATSLAFHPEDNNIIAIGMDDSTIHVYNVNVDEVKTKFSGHSKRITGLAFSSSLHVLVSAGADSQINVWGTDGWNKLRSKALQIPSGRSPTKSDLQVQFHRNQIHLLAVHETQIALYDANDLACMEQWIPGEGYTFISHAAFSCDCQLVYACFVDATVCVFDASSLKLKCRIDPTSYLPANDSLKISATVIAAHPLDRNQIAVGLTDGSVHILEPLEPKGNWGASADNGSACSSQLTESSTSQN